MGKKESAAGVGARRGGDQAVSWWDQYSTTPLTAGMTHAQVARTAIAGIAFAVLLIAVCHGTVAVYVAVV